MPFTLRLNQRFPVHYAVTNNSGTCLNDRSRPKPVNHRIEKRSFIVYVLR